jgi:hypothetical protein
VQPHGVEEVRFDIADVEAVFAVMRPYRRRRLSTVDRHRKAEILSRVRPNAAHRTLSGDEFTSLESTNGTQDRAKTCIRQGQPALSHGRPSALGVNEAATVLRQRDDVSERAEQGSVTPASGWPRLLNVEQAAAT